MSREPDLFPGKRNNIVQLFYSACPVKTSFTLDAEESRHCIRVMRMRAGDAVYLTDGRGNLYQAEIAEADARACVINVTGPSGTQPARSPGLHMAVAPTRNIDRFEWFIEKATECGIDEITPVYCEKSERKNIRHDRLEKIMLSAMKQSLRTWLPVLHQPATLTQFLERSHPSGGFIAWCGEAGKQPLSIACKPGEDAVILIGPEGDFSEEEFHKALSTGYQAISLGGHRLRTETAALAACIGFNMLNKTI